MRRMRNDLSWGRGACESVRLVSRLCVGVDGQSSVDRLTGEFGFVYLWGVQSEINDECASAAGQTQVRFIKVTRIKAESRGIACSVEKVDN